MRVVPRRKDDEEWNQVYALGRRALCEGQRESRSSSCPVSLIFPTKTPTRMILSFDDVCSGPSPHLSVVGGASADHDPRVLKTTWENNHPHTYPDVFLFYLLIVTIRSTSFYPKDCAAFHRRIPWNDHIFSLLLFSSLLPPKLSRDKR